jgi:hypothetical protein
MEQQVTMIELKNLFELHGSNVEISTPDGWVPINRWFDMGVKTILTIRTQNHTIRCADSHLIETVRDEKFVWMLANELEVGDSILTTSGVQQITAIDYDGEEECYDIEVAHHNHRYWAEGVSSHNCGKSFGVEKVLGQDGLMDTLADRLPRYEIVKGSMSSIGLYCKLYQHHQDNHVVVLDDADGIYNDEDSLNLLKGALDSGDRRTISWNKDSRILRNEGIPDRFDFRGSVIFITNLNFNYVRSKKLRAHLSALESRCHVIDLGMDTIREKFLRIHQVVGDGMLDRYDFGDEGNFELLKFMQDNALNLREISLRMVIKIANLRRAFPNGWQKMSRVTCMT